MARPAQPRSNAKKAPARPGTVKSPTDIDREVGKRLRALREEAGISQTALGDGSGITFQQVQKYENGVNRVSVSRLMQSVTCLGCRSLRCSMGLQRRASPRRTHYRRFAPGTAFGSRRHGKGSIQRLKVRCSSSLRRALVDSLKEHLSTPALRAPAKSPGRASRG